MSIHLAYAVRLIKPAKAEDQKESVLNLKDSLLNGLMDRLVMQQLVRYVPPTLTIHKGKRSYLGTESFGRRYPLIFGPFGDVCDDVREVLG